MTTYIPSYEELRELGFEKGVLKLGEGEFKIVNQKVWKDSPPFLEIIDGYYAEQSARIFPRSKEHLQQLISIFNPK